MANTRKYRNILLGLFALVIMASVCLKNDSPDKAILRVGKVTITEYELEKNLDLFLSDFTRQNGHISSKADIQDWLDQFIDRAYFLADAYDKGYDTLDAVLKWVLTLLYKPGDGQVTASKPFLNSGRYRTRCRYGGSVQLLVSPVFPSVNHWRNYFLSSYNPPEIIYLHSFIIRLNLSPF